MEPSSSDRYEVLRFQVPEVVLERLIPQCLHPRTLSWCRPGGSQSSSLLLCTQGHALRQRCGGGKYFINIIALDLSTTLSSKAGFIPNAISNFIEPYRTYPMNCNDLLALQSTNTIKQSWNLVSFSVHSLPWAVWPIYDSKARDFLNRTQAGLVRHANIIANEGRT